MRFVVLLTGIAFCFLGCVHSRVLNEATPPDTLAQINQNFAGHSATIILKSGERVGARLLRIGPDSLSYVVRSQETVEAFQNNSIDQIAYRDRRTGLREGLTSGALGGAIAGAGLGFLYYLVQGSSDVTYDSPPDSMGYISWGHSENRRLPIYECMGMGVLAGTVSGAALGVFFGGTGGSIMEVRYRFPINKPRN
jgi:hypothetical protein